MGVNTNARGYSYSTKSGNSSFHQEGDHTQDLRKVYSSGAYGPSTDWSKYSSAYTNKQTPTNDDSSKKGSTADTGSTTAYIDNGYGGGASSGDSYASMLASLLAQQRAAAQEAYDASMGRLNEAWGDTQAGLSKNLDLTRNRLKSQLDYSNGVVNNDANKSLREAYINYMMNKKNLNQGLSAMGLSGGATESSMAKLFNNYGSSRNNINTTLAENLAKLLQEYENNASQAEQLYNSQWMDARNNYTAQANALNSALLNNQMSMYSGNNLANLASYATAMNNINSTGDYTPTTNSLAVNQISTTQGNDMGSVTDYAKWKAMADNLAKQGATSDGIIYQLMQNGADANAVRSIFGY